MERIKNTEKLIKLTNELINNYGEPQDMASEVDGLIFDYIGRFMESQECGHSCIARMIDTLKGLRNFCKDLEMVIN